MGESDKIIMSPGNGLWEV